MMRPYPPRNIQVNGSRWPASIGGSDELAITWAHRDRTLQAISLNRQDDGDFGPEIGVTYTLEIYGETDMLLRTESGFTGTSYTYLQADEEADSGVDPGRINTSLRFELASERGVLVSLKKVGYRGGEDMKDERWRSASKRIERRGLCNVVQLWC